MKMDEFDIFIYHAYLKSQYLDNVNNILFLNFQ